jgi:hypothetical protein
MQHSVAIDTRLAGPAGPAQSADDVQELIRSTTCKHHVASAPYELFPDSRRRLAVGPTARDAHVSDCVAWCVLVLAGSPVTTPFHYSPIGVPAALSRLVANAQGADSPREHTLRSSDHLDRSCCAVEDRTPIIEVELLVRSRSGRFNDPRTELVFTGQSAAKDPIVRAIAWVHESNGWEGKVAVQLPPLEHGYELTLAPSPNVPYLQWPYHSIAHDGKVQLLLCDDRPSFVVRPLAYDMMTGCALDRYNAVWVPTDLTMVTGGQARALARAEQDGPLAACIETKMRGEIWIWKEGYHPWRAMWPGGYFGGPGEGRERMDVIVLLRPGFRVVLVTCDSEGTPIRDVSVMVDGSSVGKTRDDGSFVLECPRLPGSVVLRSDHWVTAEEGAAKLGQLSWVSGFSEVVVTMESR